MQRLNFEPVKIPSIIDVLPPEIILEIVEYLIQPKDYYNFCQAFP